MVYPAKMPSGREAAKLQKTADRRDPRPLLLKSPMNPPTDDFRVGLRPPQFNLRFLLIAVTGCCVLFAAFRWLNPAAIVGVSVIIASIIAHVVGNALGMQLRDHGNQKLNEDLPPVSAVPTEFAPPSKLTRRESLGRIVYIAPVATSLALATAGGFWLRHVVGAKATWGNMAFGIAAFAVLGSILGFLLGCFVKVLIAANLDAWRNGESPP